jgi:Xaa-Pro aminopeptidase
MGLDGFWRIIMRHMPLNPKMFAANRERLAKRLLPNSLAVVNANDILPMNSDAVLPMVPQTDLFYLSGIEQEETILLVCPNSFDEKLREVLFIRESSELLTIWEGHKLTKKEAQEISGIKNVKFLTEFRQIFHRLMCEVEHVYVNSNEHARSVVEVQTRDARFIGECQKRYPLHDYRRLAPLMHDLRGAKTEEEIELLRQAIEITDKGFRRVAKMVKPGVTEYEVEAEFVYEFTRRRAKFAYNPIIASGKNACVLHYLQNDQTCRKGELLLLDVAAAYANYNADLTRTIPVDGKFTKRQKQVYNAVLRVLGASIKGAVVGKLHRDWQKESQMMMNEELLELGLLKKSDIKKQTEEEPACRKYFMHGLGHFLGLDVHDLGLLNKPFQPGTVLTVEPGIYIPKEGFGVRLENNIVVRAGGAEDLFAKIPIEVEEIEELMGG